MLPLTHAAVSCAVLGLRRVPAVRRCATITSTLLPLVLPASRWAGIIAPVHTCSPACFHATTPLHTFRRRPTEQDRSCLMMLSAKEQKQDSSTARISRSDCQSQMLIWGETGTRVRLRYSCNQRAYHSASRLCFSLLASCLHSEDIAIDCFMDDSFGTVSLVALKGDPSSVVHFAGDAYYPPSDSRGLLWYEDASQ